MIHAVTENALACNGIGMDPNRIDLEPFYQGLKDLEALRKPRRTGRRAATASGRQNFDLDETWSVLRHSYPDLELERVASIAKLCGMPLSDIDPQRVARIIEDQERTKQLARERQEEVIGPAWREVIGIKAGYQKADDHSDWREVMFTAADQGKRGNPAAKTRNPTSKKKGKSSRSP
jgi:hypothetical protein